MLKIRLQRVGRKHEPVYRVVVCPHTIGPKSGKYLEILGTYDARKKDRATLKGDRISYWISQGAKPTDTVHNALIEAGILKGNKINVLPKKTPIVKEEELQEEAKAETSTEATDETPTEEAPVEASDESTDEVEASEEETSVPEEVPTEEEAPATTEEAPAEEASEAKTEEA